MIINTALWDKTIKILAICMILTGFLYPFYQQYSLANALIALYTQAGFFLWCVAMVIAGFRLYIKPHTVYTSTTPILMFLAATGYLAYQGQSLSALLVYSLLWLIPMYTQLKNNNRRDDSIAVFIPKWVQPRHVLGIHYSLFALGLLAYPDGVGLNYIYGWLSFVGNPDSLYQLIFLLGALALFNPFYSFKPGIMTYFYVLFSSFGLLIHCGVFIVVIVFQTYAWSLLPFFIAVLVLILRFIDRFYLEEIDVINA